MKNFRCYDDNSIEFHRGINLFVGDNAVGKTSLLSACNLVMNAFFSGYSDENTTWKSAEDTDFREVRNGDYVSNDSPINISFDLYDSDLPDIEKLDGQLHSLNLSSTNENSDAQFYIEKKSKKNSRNLVAGLKSLKEYASVLQLNSHKFEDGKAIQVNALPLFAYYTTEDIYTKRKFDKEKRLFKKYPQKPSFGYFECFDCKGLLDCWIKRLLVLKEAEEGEVEISCVQKAIAEALGDSAYGCQIINSIDIRHNAGKVYFNYCDGREVSTDLLSDGYRRLVSIIVDLSFRCALLNKIKYGADAYKHTHGTVIIDEIDSHLHPSLQVKIVNALQKTFPRLQFIISSHAPLVMSSVENNKDNVVYKLQFKDGKYTHTELNPYGLDASTIMSAYLDQVPRDLKIDSQIKAIEQLIDDGNYSDAESKIRELYITNPSNPEISKLETMLHFFQN